MKILNSCQFSGRGCTYKRERHLVSEIREHEKLCGYRSIFCMAKHRGACQWEGPIPDFMSHVRTSNCVQILRNGPGNLGPFSHFISDCGLPGSSVLNRTVASHWQPTLFASAEITSFLIYLTIRRSSTGLWTLVLRTFSPKAMRDRVRVQFWVHGNARAGEPASHKFTYRGGIVSHMTPNADILQAKKLLLLNDDQVRLMRTDDGTLFHYNLSVDIAPPLPRALRLGVTNGNH